MSLQELVHAMAESQMKMMDTIRELGGLVKRIVSNDELVARKVLALEKRIEELEKQKVNK